MWKICTRNILICVFILAIIELVKHTTIYRCNTISASPLLDVANIPVWYARGRDHIFWSTLLLHNRSTYQYCQRSSYGAAVYRMAIMSVKAFAKMSTTVSAMVSAMLSAKASAMASAKMSTMVSAILSVKMSAMVSGRCWRCYWRYYILLNLLGCVSSNQ